MILRILPVGLILAFASGPLFAEERATPAESVKAPAEPLPPVKPVPKSTTKSPLIQKRGKRREQKEIEGSQAPDRFEADTILKSQYSLDGQPLEVDPD